MVTFRLNDELVEVPATSLHLSAAAFIRQHTQVKSIKVSCSEGGCGACAVELLSPAGDSCVSAVNSCLLPVAALDGCHVITSEGLGNSRTGYHPVQERLAAFHGTQCGFCSPGITVATHAALAAAAHKAAGSGTSSSSSSSSSVQSACNGVSSSSSSSSSSGCPAKQGPGGGCGGAGLHVTAGQLLGVLDGNLCRCTGWRPIADCAKSFACDVDIEDLGLNSLNPDRLAPLSLSDLTPAALKVTPRQHQQHQQHHQQQQQQQEVVFAKALQQLQPGSILAPSSLDQLLQALAAAGAGGLPVHLLAGNTGAGLYKDQWGRLSSSVCVLVRGVQELQQLQVLGMDTQEAAAGAGPDASESIDCFVGAAAQNGSKGDSRQAGKGAAGLSSSSSSSSSGSSGPVLLAGAGVTITRLLESLQEVLEAVQGSSTTPTTTSVPAASVSTASNGSGAAATAAAAVGQEQDGTNLQYLICHMRRIAGTLVRNAATLGGHLALVRGSHLESDLVTLMTAAGCEVCITSLDGSSHWLDIADVCHPGQQQQQHLGVLQHLDRQQAVITAVRLALPISSSSSSGSGSSSSDRGVSFWCHKLTPHRFHNEHAAVNAAVRLLPGAAGAFDLRIAVGTYQQQQKQQQQQLDSSTGPATNGVNGVCQSNGIQQQQQQQQQGQEGVWMCSRAHALEAALLAAFQQQQQIALLQVLQDLPELLLQDVQPAGRLAGYVRRVLPGLLLKGLAAVLPPHLLQPQQQANGHVTTSSSNSSSSSGDKDGFVHPSLLLELRECARRDLAAAVAGPVFESGRQDLPVDLEAAPPLYWPTERDGGLLQASGEALYADDVPLVAGALHAAYVTSSQPHAQLLGVDWSPVLDVPGVVGWVGPQDIPAGPDVMIQEAWAGELQPLFAHSHVTHVGQALGLILAHSPAAAQEGAAMVRVTYGPPPSGSTPAKTASSSSAQDDNTSNSTGSSTGGATGDSSSRSRGDAAGGGGGGSVLTTLSAAVAADSWYDLGRFPGTSSAAVGDVAAGLSSSARVLSGQVKAGSQRHFYMEPQVAIVTPDEGGRLTVVSSCQGCDIVMYGICRALKLRHNEVHATSRRVGGGFGGKASAAVFHATAAALSALKYRRQVRLVVPQAVDVSMHAGRCPMVLDWRAGLDEAGRLKALQLDLTLMDGAYGGGAVEAISMKAVADSVYDVPAMAFNLRLARTHMPPRSTVRGPGKVSMVILLEMVMQQLAAATGSSPDDFRRKHIIQLPAEALQAAAAAEAAADGSAAVGAANAALADGSSGEEEEEEDAAAASDAPFLHPKQQQQQQRDSKQQQQLVPHPKYLPRSGPDAAVSSSSSSISSLKTSLGQAIEVHQYTLPFMMQQVCSDSTYAARRAAADAFNARHASRKRGLALVPVRYPLYRSFYTGRVSIYCDGSVLLSHAGVEIGQGISSKVKQTAAATLGQLLPPHTRHTLLPFIRVAGGSTEVMPHAGLAAGSTTSEGATAAIAAACEELVGRLQPSAQALADKGGQEGVTWEAVVKGVCGWEVLTTKVLLTASARAGFHEETTTPGAMYQSFGVGAAEVEVDCLTGERALLRADLMFDAGRSVSPAIDMGQIEGAFMNGVGYVMTEEVAEDEASGRNLTDSTWTYKPPGIAELPKVLNVAMLRDSPCHVPQRKQLSAKATGEPPLMMAAAVACALQDAVHAAWRGHEQQQEQQGRPVKGPDSWPVLQLPATTANILQALPPLLG